MKYLKTLLIAVLMFVMAISFAACGAEENTPDTGDNGDIIIDGNSGGDGGAPSDEGECGDGDVTVENEKTKIIFV